MGIPREHHEQWRWSPSQCGQDGRCDISKKVCLKEAERGRLLRWESTRTDELVEVKAGLFRHEAMRTPHGTRLRGKLLAIGRFPFHEIRIRQSLKSLEEWE